MPHKMTKPVERLVAQNIDIHDALRGAGYPAEFIVNPYGEPLAVVSRDIFDPKRVASSLLLKQAIERRDPEIDVLKDVFPLSADAVYPKEYVDIFDLVAVAAARRPGLATAFKSALSSEAQRETHKGGGLGLHADYIGAMTEPGVPLLGLNEHATHRGRYAVQLGVLRELEYADLIVSLIDKLGDNNDTGRKAMREAYLQYAGPYTEPVELGAGDMLFFQAQQHSERGLPATAHDFVTVSERRLSVIFRPEIGESDAVLAKQRELAARYELAHWGY